MINAEVLSHDLQNIDVEEIAQSVVDYIACPSSDDCTFDGNDTTPCTACKITWLRSEFES